MIKRIMTNPWTLIGLLALMALIGWIAFYRPSTSMFATVFYWVAVSSGAVSLYAVFSEDEE